MPVIKITDGRGVLVPNANRLVVLVMRYPFDTPEENERRKISEILHLYKEFLDREGEQGTNTVELAANDLRRLLSLNPEAIKHDEGLRYQKGTIAGSILGHIEKTARSSPGQASVNNAVRHYRVSSKKRFDELERHADQIEWVGVRYWKGQSRYPLFNTSDTKIREAWSEMKPVAHLYAAEGFFLPAWESLKAGKETDDFLNILADAEHLRIFGESHFARGQKKTGYSTLDPATTWRTPDDLVLPESRYLRDPPN